MQRLKRSFFSQHPAIVAPALLGKYLIAEINKKKIVTKIVETEAYGGFEDKGCHLGRFGITKRTKALSGAVGYSYVYPVYINTYCLNVVAHEGKKAGAVLIRALEPLKGIDVILKNLNKEKDFDLRKLLNGPGKLCKALQIDSSLNGIDMVKSKRLYLTEGEDVSENDIMRTPRINIPYAAECKNWLWRFVLKDSPYLSRKVKKI